MIEIIEKVLAVVGLIELILHLKNIFKESIYISLKSPENIFHWQNTQITQASYVAAKKLYQISKQIKDKQYKEKAIIISKRILDLRKRMYDTTKVFGYNETEYNAMANKSKELYTEYLMNLKS